MLHKFTWIIIFNLHFLNVLLSIVEGFRVKDVACGSGDAQVSVTPILHKMKLYYFFLSFFLP